jgi:uncharacterized membrane protein
MTTIEARPAPSRVASLDLLRGIVMVLMALDHVRVYSGLPAGGPTPGIFFTRWITHFCAPAFVFLAGTGAFLHGRTHADLSRFLATRGLWLVALDLTVMHLTWTFNLDLSHAMAGVLWAIGWCMVLMAALVRLPLRAIAAFGMLVVAGHDALDPYRATLFPAAAASPLSWLWKILYVGFFLGPIGDDHGPTLVVLYSIVPWIGVMALGYAFGAVMTLPPPRRHRLCLAIGIGAVALFLVLRGLDLYGDPRPWRAALVARPDGPPPMPAALAFLDTSKYPASLLFLLMTLGPAIAALPPLERARGPIARRLSEVGRVPLFFYLLHIPLIHALALVVSWLRLGAVSPWLFENHPMGNGPPPDGYTWSLGTLYLVWAISVVLLAIPCHAFARVKARRRDGWLSYL